MLKSLFSRDQTVVFTRFTDPLANFDIFYPKRWRFDRDVAVVDGKYSISFEGGDSRFSVSVDVSIPAGFDFDSYAKKELESPTSGIIATVRKKMFRGMPAYKREFSYSSGSKDFFGGGLMFFTGDSVFSLYWTAPKKDKEKQEAIFEHMVQRLSIHSGLHIRK
jgi:hypothetical protein